MNSDKITMLLEKRNATNILPANSPIGYIGADSNNSLCANCVGQCNCNCVCGGGRTHRPVGTNCKCQCKGILLAPSLV